MHEKVDHDQHRQNFPSSCYGAHASADALTIAATFIKAAEVRYDTWVHRPY
ncbi:hypothetical protein [Mesorhizobium escarrei]|uniref:hypothetical protein n=1 Tax=Mesorhizobium escarrei TaxID=666018 RepID=UPI0020A73666|nr:hypothetical protein [Mesorhizobium escarrei]